MNVILTIIVIFAILSFMAMIGEEKSQDREIYATTFRILVLVIVVMVGFKIYG